MTAVLLALLAAVLYGVANYVGPMLSRAHALASVLLVGQVASLAGAVVYVVVVGDARPATHLLVLGALSGICNAGGIGFMYVAAVRGPLSVVAPISAMGAVVPVVVAVVGGERPSALQLCGIPIALVGIVLTALRHEDASHHADRRTVVIAALGALAGGGFLALLGKASVESTSWALLSNRAALLVTVAVAVTLLPGTVKIPWRSAPKLALPALMLLIASAAFALATTKGLLSVAAVLTSLNPVVTIGLAALLLGERLATRQQAGVVLALMGVALMAAG
ncbi:MAG: protein of unknown function transrane [Frankiales bacterium]|nr:protein of unknown function transrane [Frankiales bacterium]